VLFSMLTCATRHEPATYRGDLLRYFKELDTHWDTAVKIPGYEPCPTGGHGNDKYLELHRHTGDPQLLARARANADAYYQRWQHERDRMKLIDQASVARTLWLVVDAETAVGREFWKMVDAAPSSDP
jgi:hypothetical protein